MIALYILVAVAVLVLALALVGYRMGLYVPPQTEKSIYNIPDSDQYAPYKKQIFRMMDTVCALPYEEVCITSYDGLRLYAKYYETAKGAPLQIMFHGYKCRGERSFCGGLQTALEGGFNALLIDQRAHGKSEGKCLTFGVKERYDCLSWVNYAVARFGADTKILLYGMSMGAATVLMAAGLDLPKNVVGIAADCGYTSPEDIVKKVLADMHLSFAYPVAMLSARIFGGFKLNEASALEAMEHCHVPVLLVHGGDDRFVPCEMSRQNYSHCASDYKRLLIVPNAGHGMSYMVDNAAYYSALAEFQHEALNK